MSEVKPLFAYQGGKTKIAGKICDFIESKVKDFTFVDICCGGGSVSIEMLNRGVPSSSIYMFDAGPIGAFWQQVSDGSFDLEWFEYLISKIPEDKALIQKYMQDLSTIEYAYVGEQVPAYLLLQAASFGGKQIYDEGNRFSNTSFRNYWQPTETSSRRSPVNPMMPMPEELQKRLTVILDQMQGVRATHCLAEDINFQYIKDSHKNEIVVYVDPPYANTTSYKDDIDLESVIEKALKVQARVFVSEYKPLGHDYVQISKTNKGGISGNSSKNMVEYVTHLK